MCAFVSRALPTAFRTMSFPLAGQWKVTAASCWATSSNRWSRRATTTTTATRKRRSSTATRWPTVAHADGVARRVVGWTLASDPDPTCDLVKQHRQETRRSESDNTGFGGSISMRRCLRPRSWTLRYYQWKIPCLRNKSCHGNERRNEKKSKRKFLKSSIETANDAGNVLKKSPWSVLWFGWAIFLWEVIGGTEVRCDFMFLTPHPYLLPAGGLVWKTSHCEKLFMVASSYSRGEKV